MTHSCYPSIHFIILSMESSAFKLFGKTITKTAAAAAAAAAPTSPESETDTQDPSSVLQAAVDQTAAAAARAGKALSCPRCKSKETKFCYFNNYNVNQPRHFCKACHRYWTAGGTLRNVPIGAGRRKNRAQPPARPGGICQEGDQLDSLRWMHAS